MSLYEIFRFPDIDNEIVPACFDLFVQFIRADGKIKLSSEKFFCFSSTFDRCSNHILKITSKIYKEGSNYLRFEAGRLQVSQFASWHLRKLPAFHLPFSYERASGKLFKNLPIY